MLGFRCALIRVRRSANTWLPAHLSTYRPHSVSIKVDIVYVFRYRIVYHVPNIIIGSHGYPDEAQGADSEVWDNQEVRHSRKGSIRPSPSLLSLSWCV